MSKTQQSISTKGWNWGYYHMKEDKMDLTHDKEGSKKCFSLNYKDITLSNASSAKEVTLEFQQEEENKR